MNVRAFDGGGSIDRILRMLGWGAAGLLFLAPVVAEQVWAEMAWSASDFVIWGLMLLGACGAGELALRSSASWTYRTGAVVTIGAMFMVFWATGAVGIVGSEDHPANLLYAAVLAVGVGGAFAADFKARGMARATLLMAVATGLVGVFTVAGRWGSEEAANWLHVAVFANGFFATAWLFAAWLFRRAAREQAAGAEA
ncbi:MAG TPA: hypothetical protein VF699_12445 [Caulobacteraceae bacterium]|jgi:hypothetical protein